MTDILSRIQSGKLWDFDGGIHPPEMKDQSNKTPISNTALCTDFYVPVKQHAGSAGNLLIKVGDQVLKGQALTQGEGLRTLPVHAPTSGEIIAIAPYVSAHPSGLTELMIHIRADGKDQWREQHKIADYRTLSSEQLIEKIYQAGVAGLGGAVFPTAAKIHSAENQVKLLIINGAECEPYITSDDRLMREYAEEITQGVQILDFILQPQKIVIAIEDNKPEAISAMQQAVKNSDIEVRVIPTKYPSGAAKQLIQILTGMEVGAGKRSSSIGVLMHNVGTAFAIKRAVMDDEPLIERVVTLTGEKVVNKGNRWVRIGTPISFVLEQAGFKQDNRLPVFVGGPMMGLMLPDLNTPVTKLANCLLAPDETEYDLNVQEQSCIRCSACSDACPVHLMPQQLYWFSRSEDHDNATAYNIKDCIECGLCAYVCPSHIPLIQYFRQEKAKIWQINETAKQAEAAKLRFEAKQARFAKEEEARKARTAQAATQRREQIAAQQGEDPVQAALARLKAKKAQNGEQATMQIKKIATKVSDNGENLPDNSQIMAARLARREQRLKAQQQAACHNTGQNTEVINNESAVSKSTVLPTAADDPKKAAIAAAIARAKAKKAQVNNNEAENSKTEDQTETVIDPKKAAVAGAIARAKAKKAQANTNEVENSRAEIQTETTIDPKKAAIAAAIARAKAKKAQANTNEIENSKAKIQTETTIDPKKAAIAAAIARAKTKKAQANNHETENSKTKAQTETAVDPKKAAVAAAIARAKAKKATQENK